MPSSRAAWADHLAKVPAKPDHGPRKPRANKVDARPLEKHIQKAILQWLATQPDLMVERMNTGAVVATHKGRERFVQFGTPGGPDIRVVVPVRVPTCICGGKQNPVDLAIECKRPGGKQSEAQKAWQAKWEAAGNVYRVVTTLDEAIRAVTEARGK